ncbi:MAG TPA: diguanylate cyclase [Candidatus Ozemobacteraceae bacterium]
MPIYTTQKQQSPETPSTPGGFRLFLGWLIAFLVFFALPLGILLEGYRVYLQSISRDERAAFSQYLTRELTSFRNNAANDNVIQQLARNYRDAVRKKLPDFPRTVSLSTDLASALPSGSTLLAWDGKGQPAFPPASATPAPARAFVQSLSRAYTEVSQDAFVTGEAPNARFAKDNAETIRNAAPLTGLSFPYLDVAAAPGTIHHAGADRQLICFWDTFVTGSPKSGGFAILVPVDELSEAWGLTQLLAADPTANPEQTSGFIDTEANGRSAISYKPLGATARRLFEKYRQSARSPVVEGDWNLLVLPFSPTSSISLFTLYSTARFRNELEGDESLGLVFASVFLLAGIVIFFLFYRASSAAGLSLRTKIAGLFGLSMLLPLSILSLLALHYSLDHEKILQDESNQLLQNEMKRLDDGAGEFYRNRAAWLRSLRSHPALAGGDRKAITELFLSLYKERRLHRAYLVDASGTVLFDQDHLFDEYGRKAFVGELGRRAIEADSGLGRDPAEQAGHDALARNLIARLATRRGVLQPVNWPGTSRRTSAFIDLVPPPPGSTTPAFPQALIVTLDLDSTDEEYLTAAIRDQDSRSEDLRLFALSREDISITIPALNPTLRANLLPLVSLAQLREYPEAARISDERRPLLAALTSGKNLDGYYIGASIGWQSVTAPLHQTYGSLLAALLVSICGSLLLVTFLIRGVVDPISSLSLGTRAIAAGDLSRTLPVLERDELGDLSRAFNDMTKRLRSRLTELTVLYTLTQKASTVTNQREVFALAARHLRDHLSAADCGTAWIDGSDGWPNLAEARDKASGDVIRKAISTALQTRVNTLVKLPGDAGTVLGIPLFFEEKDFGGLYLIFAPPGPQPVALEVFTADERSFIETLRHHLSLIIEKQRLFEQAITDGLTHLYVRRFFLASLEKEIARSRRYRTDIALLMLDIDHFKRFNDTWGHQVGDLVLRETSQRIIEHIRAVDTPGRYGGEELAIILPQTTMHDAAIVAERIRRAIADAAYTTEGNSLNVTVSIGVTSLRDRCLTMEALIAECDKALYKAKAEGRNRVVQAEIEMTGGAS